MNGTRLAALGAATLAAATLVLACARKDDASATAATGEPAGGAITMWTDSVELFMEHPALIVGAPDKFAVHLTDLTDFAPLRAGKITLRFQPRTGGAPVVVTQDAPRAPGIYGPAPEFKAAGDYDLTLLVDSPQARDSMIIRGLRVYATAAEAPRDSGDAGGGISFLKEQQWKTPGFRTVFADSGSVVGAFDVTGVIEPAAGRWAEVTAPISGLVDAGGVARSPAPGQRVSRGQVLATLTPSLGDAGSAFAEARARLAEAQDEHQRAQRLVEAEAAPARRLHEAGIRLRAAREALAGFGGAAADGRIAVRAPVGGVVARRTIAPGSHVEAGAPLFTIVDPSVVWLTVNVPAAQASLVSGSSSASFQLEGSSRRWDARRIVSVGSVIDPQSRTLPVIYEVPNGDGAIRVGSTARAQVRTGRRTSGVIIPAGAVVEEDGRPVAFVQPEGESFERRELVLGGREGDRVLVVAGINVGERVVSGAAYQVRLASLSTAVPAHGHAH